MKAFSRIRVLFRITHARRIIRRYFVTNGFDGVLTMLGLLMGFHISQATDLMVAINACMGAAVALGMSGLSSAYISEAAERKRELRALEQALLADLSESDYGRAARFVPVIVALVNGFAPFLLSLLIMTPLWMGHHGIQFPLPPLETSIALALLMIFLLGIFLGQISGTSWIWMGIKATMLGLLTAGLILLTGMAS